MWILSQGVRWGGKWEWDTNPAPGFPWPGTASLGSWCCWFPGRSVSLDRLCPWDTLAPYLLTGLLLLWQRLSLGSMSLHSLWSMLIFMQQHEGTEQNRRKGIAGSAASEQEGEDRTGWERLTLGLQLVKAENQVDTLDKGCDFCLQGKEMATAFLLSLVFSAIW